MNSPGTSSEADLAALPLYTHAPLTRPEKEIRLLELLPGNDKDIIRCKIHHKELKAPTTSPSKRKSLKAIQATLDSDWGVKETIEGRYLFYSQALGTLQWDHPDPEFDKSLYEMKALDEFQPRFEALSYTWGTEPPCGFIIVEGTTVTKFPVRENLLAVLQQLRYTDNSRTLWIDAICINQNDNDERRIQVGRMASIYRLCYRVVVWLGPEEDNSNLALQALNKIGLQIELFTDWSRTLSPDGTEKSWFLPETVIPYDEETWSAIGRLLERPWFRRLWVVQEFKLGNSSSIMQCGQEVIPTSIFRRAVVCLSQKLDRAKEISWETLLDTNQLVYSSDKLCFRVMMSQVKEKLCSDPRDKIYGVLSLAPKGLAADVPADYTKDPGQLFLDLFLAHAKNVRRLEMFHQCSQLSRNLDIPSWVPDWTAPSMVRQLIEDQFSAAFSEAEFSFTPPNMLHVTGIRCAFISETLSYMPDEATDAEKIRIARSWQPEDLETGTYITGESMRMAHAKTLCMNTLEERFPGFQLQPDEAFWEEQDFDHPLFGDDLEDVPDSYEIPLEYRDIQNALNRCSNRRYFKTDEGYIGIAPADTQPNDAIVVLLGCSRPLVLRPTTDDQWILIGECFVLGLNDATALLGPLPEPWRVREIFSEGERYAPHFYNPDEDIVTLEDPRLDPLDEWERIEHEVDVDDPEIYNYIRNKITGEETPFDPRLSADSLRARGVPLRQFDLI
ncbi:hypothetical protein NM208_g10467 [Fusarium decemcellulare]|uniref:Uncharacterized protein n=1 Tax=Fusarium decemcellulare TaxID=57161 RepID=A0ACC1RXT1_9HYPO|nr:hypothetical protein NM208_g10467 [Fusarium decemcellulare]